MKGENIANDQRDRVVLEFNHMSFVCVQHAHYMHVRLESARRHKKNSTLFRHQKPLCDFVFCIENRKKNVKTNHIIYKRMKKATNNRANRRESSIDRSKLIGLDDWVRGCGWCFGAYAAAVALVRSVVCDWNMRLILCCVIRCRDVMRCRWHRECWRLIQWISRGWVVCRERSQRWPHWWSGCSQWSPHRMSHRW